MSIRIGVGGGIGLSLEARDYWRFVDWCEDSGIDSLWQSDQLLGKSLEPMAVLAGLAARTRRMRFGTNALVLPFREPLIVAREFATIDFLSEGRLLPVFGIGNASDPYWAATGTPSAGRGKRSDEAIALIKLLLVGGDVNFAGDHFTYHGPGAFPVPAKPIPLWTGGNSAAAVRRTAELGDGWLGGPMGPELAGRIRLEVEQALRETGRTIDADHYGVTVPFRIGSAGDSGVEAARARLRKGVSGLADDAIAVGTADDIAALFQRHVAAGMSKFVALPIASGANDLMGQLDLLRRDVIPQVEDR